VNEILLSMIGLIQTSKSEKNLNSSKGDFFCQLSDYDYISFMEIIVEMYQQEQDVKEILFYSLHENENPLVLSSYIITWKSLPFIKDLEEMNEAIELNERMNSKLKTNF
jgi:hypothetical protein